MVKNKILNRSFHMWWCGNSCSNNDPFFLKCAVDVEANTTLCIKTSCLCHFLLPQEIYTTNAFNWLVSLECVHANGESVVRYWFQWWWQQCKDVAKGERYATVAAKKGYGKEVAKSINAKAASECRPKKPSFLTTIGWMYDTVERGKCQLESSTRITIKL